MATAFSLDRFARSRPLDRVRAVEKGLPARALRQLAADPAITMADLAQAIGTRRTLDRRLKEDSRLSLEEGDRLDSFIQVLDPIFQDPPKQDRLGLSAHFYAPYKIFLGREWPTLLYDLVVIWLLNLGAFLLLYFDVLKKIFRLSSALMMKAGVLLRSPNNHTHG